MRFLRCLITQEQLYSSNRKLVDQQEMSELWPKFSVFSHFLFLKRRGARGKSFQSTYSTVTKAQLAAGLHCHISMSHSLNIQYSPI